MSIGEDAFLVAVVHSSLSKPDNDPADAVGWVDALAVGTLMY